jgi:large subunit ribosomal protein L15
MAEKNTAETAAAEKQSALKVHHLRPAPGAKTAKTRVGRGEGSKVRPQVAVPRVRRPATR